MGDPGIWLAPLAALPYTLSRVLWAVGIPVGFSSAGLGELDIAEWGSLTVLGLAVLAEAHVKRQQRAISVSITLPHHGGPEDQSPGEAADSAILLCVLDGDGSGCRQAPRQTE